MAIKQSWNAFSLRTELSAIEAELKPHLSKANIQTASIEGKAVPISEAPLVHQIKSLMAVNPVGEDKQRDADLIVTNADIAARLEKAESDLSVTNGTVGGLQNKMRELETRATTAESTVQTLTATGTQKDLEANSLRSENARLSRENIAKNTAITVKALEWGAVAALVDANKQPLPANATPAQKQAAAELIPFEAKLEAIGGAVTAALNRANVPAGQIPSAPAGGMVSEQKMPRKEFEALEPKEQTAFFASKGKIVD